MRRVTILGAGPAGLSAAINLAREGFQISVYEKNQDVGKRFKGDFQGLENWTVNENILKSFKKMNIKFNFDYTPFKSFTLSDGDKFWNFHLNRPAFYLVKRGPLEGTLDHGLKEQALDLGVDIHFGETVPGDDVGRLYVGEAAGIQDLLWGFGIRSAVTSGFLAAKALIHNKDYGELAKSEFKNKLKSGIVNRFLWELTGDYSWIVDRVYGSSDPLNYVGSFHNFNMLQRLLYPLARFHMKRRYDNLRL
ncbi:MAG: NAD(P)/FAD-dependent oxidoreductase [Methanobacterium sp.]|nr:NAD(P)/FAD-dependent oxidoreductase [Methanobacterium sp.]